MRSTPVQKLAASLSRKIAGPTSSSVAMRPSGVSRLEMLDLLGDLGRVFMGVAV